MNKLSEVELRTLDLKLFDYQQIDRKIAIRKLEIQTETSNDCNVIPAWAESALAFFIFSDSCTKDTRNRFSLVSA